MPTFHEPKHSLGAALSVEHIGTRRAVAWWIASELVRRHPHDLFVSEVQTHGLYGLSSTAGRLVIAPRPASEYQRKSMARPLVISTELDGLIHTPMDGGGQFSLTEALVSSDRRSYIVEQLEACIVIDSPAKTPPTAASSIGPRLVSALSSLSILGRTSWQFVGGVSFSGGVPTPRTHLLAYVPHAPERFEPVGGDFNGEPAYRYWFGLPGAPPDWLEKPSHWSMKAALLVDTWRGLAWCSSGQSVDLLDAYHSFGRSMFRLGLGLGLAVG